MPAKASDIRLLIDPSRADSTSDTDGHVGVIVGVGKSSLDGGVRSSLPAEQVTNQLTALFCNQRDAIHFLNGLDDRLEKRLEIVRIGVDIDMLEPAQMLMSLKVVLGDGGSVDGCGRPNENAHFTE